MSFPSAPSSNGSQLNIPAARNGAPGQRFVPLREHLKAPRPPTGGSQPDAGSPALPDPRQLNGTPQRSLSREGICWVAAHGGAGASTLTGMLGGIDLGCRWPDPAQGEPARIMLVARTNAGGLQSASRALNAIREGRHPDGMQLVALVLVADSPGGLPGPLKRLVRTLRGSVPVHQIPWVPEWRLGKTSRKPPKQLLRVGALAGAAPR